MDLTLTIMHQEDYRDDGILHFELKIAIAIHGVKTDLKLAQT
jgi:hypothetical protein